MAKRNPSKITESSGNVFADIGLPNPDARLAEADTRRALKLALDHVEELADAWQRGALSEHDGKGGTRSNRNHDVLVALRKVLKENLGG